MRRTRQHPSQPPASSASRQQPSNRNRTRARRTKASLTTRPSRTQVWRLHKCRSPRRDTRYHAAPAYTASSSADAMPPTVEAPARLRQHRVALQLKREVRILLPARLTAPQDRTVRRRPTVPGQLLHRCRVTRLLPPRTIPAARQAVEHTTPAVGAVVHRTHPAVTAEATVASLISFNPNRVA